MAITDLNELLRSMAPELLPDEYVFCTIPTGCYADHASAAPIARSA